MRDIVIAALPVVIPALLGGGVLTFVMALLKRRDDSEAKRQGDAAMLSERGRVYEVAYRKSDAWGRGLSQLILPALAAHSQGKSGLALEFLGLVASYLGTVDENGRFRATPHPDWVALARAEMDAVDGDV